MTGPVQARQRKRVYENHPSPTVISQNVAEIGYQTASSHNFATQNRGLMLKGPAKRTPNETLGWAAAGPNSVFMGVL